MQGGDHARDQLAHRLADRQGGDLCADGFAETRRGFAGRCGQLDAQWLAGLQCRLLEQGQQAHHAGGLAGTRPTGDQAEGTACRQGAGHFLPVAEAFAVLLGRAAEQLLQTHGEGCGEGLLAGQAGGDLLGHSLLVVPVAAQVEALAIEYQRAVAGLRRTGQGALLQAAQPVVEADLLQQAGRRQCAGGGIDRQPEARLGKAGGQVQADMAVTELQAAQRRTEQQQWRAVRVQFHTETRQRDVQYTQPALALPAVEQRQHGLAVVQCRVMGRQQGQLLTHRLRSLCWPRNSSSRASSRACGGRSRNSPWLGAAWPRRNR